MIEVGHSAELSPDAVGVTDGYCPLHRGLHSFEIVPTHAGTRMDGAVLPNGEPATHGLRSPFACAVQRPVDLRYIRETEASDRWKSRLDVEHALLTDPTAVSLDDRIMLLRETLVDLDQALVLPVDRSNRVIARHLGIALAVFMLCFGAAVTTHLAAFAYLSVVSLVSCVLTPFVTKALLNRAWRRRVLDLAPTAIGQLGLSREQIATEAHALRPRVRRVTRRRTLRRFLAAERTPAHPGV